MTKAHAELPAYLLAVLRALNRGRTTAEIAHQRGVTVASVRQYYKLLHRHFGTSSLEDLLHDARASGTIPLPTQLPRPRWLTPLRLEYLRLAQHGYAHREIALRTGKTQANIDKSFEYIRARLSARTTADAVDIAITLGYLKGRAPTTMRNPLSRRECEILEYLAQGYSGWYIHKHVVAGAHARIRRLRAKLRVDTNEALVDAVERLGLHTFEKRPSHVARSSAAHIAAHQRPERLTERQIEILDELQRNPLQTEYDLAGTFGVSRTCISQHVFLILRYYGARNREELQERLAAVSRSTSRRQSREQRRNR